MRPFGISDQEMDILLRCYWCRGQGRRRRRNGNTKSSARGNNDNNGGHTSYANDGLILRQVDIETAFLQARMGLETSMPPGDRLVFIGTHRSMHVQSRAVFSDSYFSSGSALGNACVLRTGTTTSPSAPTNSSTQMRRNS